MKKKTVLIDLGALSNINCGVGQIALNYGNLFSAMTLDDMEFAFLVPRRFSGYFGSRVRYIEARKIYKYFPFLFPEINVWHAIHHYCRIGRSFGGRSIFTIHDLNFIYEISNKRRIKRYLQRQQRQIDRADVITVISNFTAGEVRRHFDIAGKPLRVISNGVEWIAGTEGHRPAFKGDTMRPFFFTIGQVLRKKNFHVLLDVMRAFPGHDLYIAGDAVSDYAAEIHSQIATKNLKNVFLPGPIPQDEKIWLYHHCEAFLFPSLLEGFGMPVIEAMQFGKPVFASNCTSLPEICGGHAFLWENFIPDYMIRSIKQFVTGFHSDPNRAKRAKAHAATFNYDRHIAEYLKLYKEMLGEHSP